MAVNLGVIGCGKVFTDLHAAALRRVAGVKVVAVADPIESRRTAAAHLMPSAAVFPDWRRLLEQAPVDAIVISTPPADHVECAREAFAAKKHVYVEKPLAVNLAQATSILSANQSAGTLGMMGFNYRFHPFYLRARELVRRDGLGKIVEVQSTFTSAGWLSDWRRTRATGGGALLDLATHHLDVVPFIAGESIVEISAELESHAAEQDTARVQAVLGSGALMQSFFCLHQAGTNRIEIRGTAAKLIIDLYAPRFELSAADGTRSFSISNVASRAWLKFERVITRGYDPSYEAAFAAFANAIANGGTSISPDLTDGMQMMQIVDAAERSASSGTPCKVQRFEQAAQTHEKRA